MDDKLQKDMELMQKPVPENEDEKSRIEDILLDNFCSSSSSDDCTGLIPEGNGQDQTAYRDIYPYAIPIRNNKSIPPTPSKNDKA